LLFLPTVLAISGEGKRVDRRRADGERVGRGGGGGRGRTRVDEGVALGGREKETTENNLQFSPRGGLVGELAENTREISEVVSLKIVLSREGRLLVSDRQKGGGKVGRTSFYKRSQVGRDLRPKKRKARCSSSSVPALFLKISTSFRLPSSTLRTMGEAKDVL
jgi:hypothetical protein